MPGTAREQQREHQREHQMLAQQLALPRAKENGAKTQPLCVRRIPRATLGASKRHGRWNTPRHAAAFPLCFACVLARVIITRKRKRAERAVATKTLAVAPADL